MNRRLLLVVCLILPALLTMTSWAAGKEPIIVNQGPLYPARAVATDPRGGYMLAGASTYLTLWTMDGRKLRRWKSGRRDVYKVAVGRNADRLASANVNIKLWNRGGKLIRSLRGHKRSVTDLRFHPSGNTLLSSSKDGTVKLWNSHGRLLKTLRGHGDVRFPDFGSGNEHPAAWSGDGRLLACGGPDGRIHFWSQKGVKIRTITPGTGAIERLALDRTGSRIAFVQPYSKEVRIHEATGKKIESFKTESSFIKEIAFTDNDQKLMVADKDGVLEKYDLDGDKDATIHDKKHDGSPASWNANGRVAVVSQGKKLLLFRNGEPTRTLLDPSNWIVQLHPAPGSAALGFYDLRTGGVLNVASLRIERMRRPHGSTLTAVQFDARGRKYATAANDGLIRVMSRNGELSAEMNQKSPVFGLAFDPRGEFLVSGAKDNRIRFWSMSGKLLRSIPGEHRRRVRGIFFSPDGERFASLGADPYIRLRDRGGRVRRKLRAGAVYDLAWSPDGAYLAATYKRRVRIWSRSGRSIRSLRGHRGNALAVAYDPSGKYIVSSAGGRLYIWTARGRRIKSIRGHNDAITGLHFLGRKPIFASVSADERIKLWSIPDGKLLATIVVFHDDSVLVYRPDGRFDVSSKNAFKHFGFRTGANVSRAGKLYEKRRLRGLLAGLIGL